MNIVLLMIVLATYGLAACAWLSPDFLRRVARYANARAAALNASRSIYARTFNASMGRTAASR